ncbi:hypothetical protein pCXcHC2016_05 [Xenohaliotis phage pCXc-HC2016]|nr:hypothetical protein pCXcHC2016_05 [Xenohaliotis phage pCXc-HC2016]AQW89112.1 hypothetical protein pCXcHR2015_05 [Xenohaliotis phage pCXc-HR2015]
MDTSHLKPTPVTINSNNIPDPQPNSVLASDSNANPVWKSNPLGDTTQLKPDEALVVDTVDTSTETVTYKSEPFVPADDGTLSLVNQTGIIGSIATTTGNLTVTISAYKAVFYNPTTNTRVLIDKSQETITIAAAGQNNHDITWIELLIDGSYSQTTTPPSGADILSRNFITEVDHPAGGTVVGTKPIYKPYSMIQTNMRALGNALGVSSGNFNFSYNAATGVLNQNSNTAKIFGYGVGEFGYKEFLNGSVTGRYHSFDPAEKGNFTTLLKTYKIDDPIAGTSSDIGVGNFGILLLFASVSGEYLLLAPQQEFNDANNALANILLYPSQVTRPKELDEFFKMVASIIVPKTVGTNNNDVVVYTAPEIGFGGASATVSGGSPVPDPSTGNAGDRLVINAAGDALEYKPEPSIDTTGATPASVLQRNADGTFKVADIATSNNLAFQGDNIRVGVATVNVVTGAVSNYGLDFVTDKITMTYTRTASVNLSSAAFIVSGIAQSNVALSAAYKTTNPVSYVDGNYTSITSIITGTIAPQRGAVNFVQIDTETGLQKIVAFYRLV